MCYSKTKAECYGGTLGPTPSAIATNNMVHNKADQPEGPPAGFSAADGDL